jgi:abscisic acid receptor (PYR/PYL family)
MQVANNLFPGPVYLSLHLHLRIYIYISISSIQNHQFNHKINKMPSSLHLDRITQATAASHKKQTSWTVPLSNITDLVPDKVMHHHTHAVRPDQCCSAVVQTISASVSTVWSVVRRFDNPQAYKHFLKSCHVILGDGNVGTLREVHVVSGLPAASSTERLDILDDERHIMSFSIVGGDHRLNNYRSMTTLHTSSNGLDTVVVESYVVDVPLGNTKEDTCVFTDMIVRCNLQSLSQFAENLNKTNTKAYPD